MLSPIVVHKILPDGSQWGEWDGFRLPLSNDCPTVWSPRGTLMRWRPATWASENHSISFFWPGRWYVIHAFYDQDHLFAGCYCDIVMPNPPVAADAAAISYTDLYIDVVVRADHSVLTKDQEVYARAMLVHPLLAELHDQAFAELDDLAAHAQEWTGPFALLDARLTRADWHELDPASATYTAACAAQWHLLK